MKALEWLLRLAVAGEFLGAGLLALRGEADYLAPLAGALGLGEAFARRALVVFGALDVAVAALALLRPWRPALLYGVAWGLGAAALPALAPAGDVWVFLAAAPAWAAPLALWVLLGGRRRRGL